MKKTFKLSHPKIKYPRLVDAVRSDVRKYIKRERRKELPEGVDFWDFDCKYGATEEAATVVHVAEIGDCIGKAETEQLESFYIEILAKPGHRTKKPVTVSETVPEVETASEDDNASEEPTS
jgi:hypothetical protein